tara:strand:+ start:997 stop:1662 length:666 start_codon:yes stop_codon:yes gene_type:complete
MILKNKYNQVMDHLEVTEEMQDSILYAISKYDFDLSEQSEPQKKTFRLPKHTLSVVTAVCCIGLFIFGSVLIYNQSSRNDQTEMASEDSALESAPSSEVYASRAALSESVGFEVESIQTVPFEVETRQYTSGEAGQAMIEFFGSENALTFIKEESISEFGDGENSAELTETLEVNGVTVSLSGEENQIYLAEWQNDGFNYRLQFDQPISESALIEVINSIQ